MIFICKMHVSILKNINVLAEHSKHEEEEFTAPKDLPTTKISHRKAMRKLKNANGAFGKRHLPPVSKSLFSFASIRPGSKKSPFTYGAKLIAYRLGDFFSNLTMLKPSQQVTTLIF